MAFTYRGLTAKLDRHIVTGEEIDRQLQRLQQQTPRIAVVTDRPTESGDEVVLDYAGFCDGVQFPGGTAEKQTLVLGSGTFIPGFEEQLLDKVCGEKVTVHVTFPTAYHAPELAGKAAEFRCVIHQIRVKTAYQLDDTFAKEVGGCDTLEEMRTKLRESLQAYADERGEMDLQDRLLRQAAATLDYTPTAEEMEYAMDQQMETLKAQLARQGLSIEMYCSFLGTDEAKLREEARAAAEAMLRSQAAIDRIVILEGLEAEPDEIAEALALICRQNDMTMEQLKPYYDAEFEKAVVRSVLSTKVTKLIRDAAIITETL
jgi:trigger factor